MHSLQMQRWLFMDSGACPAQLSKACEHYAGRGLSWRPLQPVPLKGFAAPPPAQDPIPCATVTPLASGCDLSNQDNAQSQICPAEGLQQFHQFVFELHSKEIFEQTHQQCVETTMKPHSLMKKASISILPKKN